MAKPVEITDANFEEIVNGTEQPIMIDFWAEWCGPCKMLTPIVEELSNDYEGKAVVAKLDVDANPAVASKFSIRSIPTILFFKNGEIVDKQVGYAPKGSLAAKLDSTLA